MTTSIRSGANDSSLQVNGIDSLNFNLGGAERKLESVTCTQSAGALTFTLNPTVMSMRSATLTDGTLTTVKVNSAVTLTLPSGGTLGFPTTVQGRIYQVLMSNGELAIVSAAGGNDLSETGVISTTAISAGSTANNVFYSTTARTGLAYRVVGAVDAVNTAGAWGNPVLVQGAGGLFRTPQTSMVRLNTANGYGSTNTVIRRFTNVTVNQGSDITYADSATLGASFTINTNGVYAISFTDQYNNASGIGISLNSSQLTTAISSINISDRVAYNDQTAANFNTHCGATLYITTGSIIRPHCTATPTGAANNAIFTITRVS